MITLGGRDPSHNASSANPAATAQGSQDIFDFTTPRGAIATTFAFRSAIRFSSASPIPTEGSTSGTVPASAAIIATAAS